MTVLLALLVTAGASFAFGWYGRGWWIHSKTHEKVVEVVKPKFTPFGIAYFVMFAVIVGSIIYSNATTTSKVDASEIRQNDRNTAQLACLSKTFEEFLAGNQKLRVANAKWQQALVESKTALRELVYLKIIKGVEDSAEVQAEAMKYMQATQDFIDASAELTAARKTYQLPKFEDRCGGLQPGFKGAWLNSTNQYPTGLSIEEQ